MTMHQIAVLYSGVAFFVAGLFTLGVFRMLGPSDKDRLTLSWTFRGIVALHATACLLRGATLVFPGRAVAVEHMSPFVPMAASTTLLVSAAVAEVLQRYRLPPAALDRFIRAVRAFREPGEAGLVEGGMALSVAATCEPPALDAPHVRFASPTLRRAVLTAAGMGLAIVLLVVLHAAAATLPAV